MSLETRPARAADTRCLEAIEGRAFAHDRLSRRSLRRFVGRPSASVLVADEGGTVAGYLILLFRRGSTIARLYSIAMAPEHAGRGHGRALLAAALAEASRRGASRLSLEVREDNDAARALYAGAGFRETGRRAGYYADGGDALVMGRPLDPPADALPPNPSTGADA